MKTVKVIISQEYRLNLPSVFAIIDGRYYGCLIYPHARNYPNVEYWDNATSSDSGRKFTTIDKTFSLDEIAQIMNLQALIDMFAYFIPAPPIFPRIEKTYKIKKGAAYMAYKEESDRQAVAYRQYMESIKDYSAAKTKAFSQLRGR